MTATPNSGYQFVNWSTGSGSNPLYVTMSSALNVTANFNATLVNETIATKPSGLSITVDGSPYTAPYTFQWQPGSAHTIATTNPQMSGSTWYALSSWSDGNTSPQPHTIYASSITDTAGFTVATGYEPTVTEINLGGVPIDNYLTTNGSQLPSCNSGWTVQQCIKYFFNNNPNASPYTPNNYIAQGVTGVRFFFTLRGGFGSTPFDADGNIQGPWVQKLQAFLSDLYSYGIVRVTPTPVLDPGWGDPTFVPSSPINDCTGQLPLQFLPWMPFGYHQSDGAPDCADRNDAYSIANANTGTDANTGKPIFWGWTPLFNLFNQIFATIASSGLQLGELDLDNEVNLQDFTVYARLIYDMSHSIDVTGTLRSYASNNRLNPYVITVSVPADRPSAAAYDCGSVYGDSAYFMMSSELLAAYAGGYIQFGLPSGFSYNNRLVCGGSTTGMISLPVSYQTPAVIDNHVYPCVFSLSLGHCDPNQDATSTATQMYSDLWALLQYRGLTGNVAMMGETQSGQNCAEDHYTAAMAAQNVNGYVQSTLYTGHASLTTMRVWNNDGSSCYSVPTVMNPPYNSNR